MVGCVGCQGDSSGNEGLGVASRSVAGRMLYQQTGVKVVTVRLGL